MNIAQLEAIVAPLARAKAAEEASKRAVLYMRACDRIRDAGVREEYGEGRGLSYQAIADEVGVSKSLVAGACKH